ncbi:FecR domain-containing protein [bacterium]|nr:FecR domain-containing protein [bacterium]
MKRFRILILATVISLFCQPFTLAQTSSVGTMTLHKGIVKLRRNLVDTIYQKTGEQIPVRNLDEIQTGKDSSVTIKLDAKDDELELYSQSFFKIDNVTPESSQLSMTIGKARFKIQKGLTSLKPRKDRKKRFSVRTANAIVGVRGTEFVMAAGTEVTSVLTIEGIVEVASVAAPEIEVEVGENQASQIKLAATPTAPVTVPVEVRETILTTDTPNAFNNVQFGESVPETGLKQDSKKKPASEEKKETSKPAEKKETPAKESTKSGATAAGSPSQSKTGISAPGTTGVASPGTGSTEQQESPTGAATNAETSASPDQTGEPESGQNAVFGADAGNDAVFDADAGTTAIGDDEAINLENLDVTEIDDIDIEEPEIDTEDIFDVDTLIDSIVESTDELEEEIADIQEEILENQLQQIRIKINHN